MIEFFKIAKLGILLLSMSTLLCGCLGGTIAQQIARSIATSMADSAVATAMDVQELEQDDRYSLQKKILVTENSALTQNSLSQTNMGLQTNSSFEQQANKSSNGQLNSASFNAQNFKESPPDPYTLAFMNARFNEVKPTTEPLPAQLIEPETTISHAKTSLDNKQPLAISEQPKANKLVQVELFNLLIGDEKAAIYNKAQLLGAISLPKQREWKLWRVATGVVKENEVNKGRVKSKNTNPADNKLNNSANAQQIITFLIPPEFGRLASGSITLVEMASPGELNIARYKIN